jgi:hypothetical protein
VLPRWSDVADIRVNADGVGVRLAHRGRHGRVTHRWSGVADGRPLLDVVGDELRRLPPRTPVHFRLSNHLVRYALVPFNAAVVGVAATQAVARQVFRHVHGAVADGWDITVTEGAPGAVRVAAALDGTLRHGLLDAAQAAHVHVAAIEPLLMTGFNAAREHLLATGWFAVVEPGKIVLARTVNGQWHRIAAARCDGHWRHTIQGLIQRELPWVEGEGERFCQVALFGWADEAEGMDHAMHVISAAGDADLREAA